jgi:hypothetical protein
VLRKEDIAVCFKDVRMEFKKRGYVISLRQEISDIKFTLETRTCLRKRGFTNN